MIFRKIWMWALLCVASLAVGCTTPNEESGMDDGYGYVQFKLYKKASYVAPESGTKAASNDPLEWLADAYKVRVLLGYGDNEITQTLTLTGGEGDAAEWGLRSGKLKLITGDYTLLNYTIYNAEDVDIHSNVVTENNTFTIIGGGLVMHDIPVNVVARGKVKFNLKKDIEDVTRAVEREYTFDEIGSKAFASLT